ncbi:MAG: glutathione S-transferase family protein [Gammaproteobacteria bacterium]|nr:glutathione S-transferase family protein [Gammaproteobacteria bacterium]
MQLYVFPPSPNSLCCQAVANRCGIELEVIPVDLPGGGHMQPEFVKLNPNHKIPTLVDDGFSLWESSAIMLYLAQQAGDANLIPEDAKLRVQMAQWMFWKTAHFGPACGVYTFENLVKPMMGIGEPDAAKIENAAEDFHRFFTVLNDQLAGKQYVLGSTESIADYSIVTWLVHAEAASFPMQDYEEIKRWAAEMLATDHWKAALATIPAG